MGGGGELGEGAGWMMDNAFNACVYVNTLPFEVEDSVERDRVSPSCWGRAFTRWKNGCCVNEPSITELCVRCSAGPWAEQKY